MRLLRKHTAKLIREGTKGSYNEEGDWVDNPSPKSSTIRCSIQPDFEGITKKFVPDHVLEKDCRVVYTETRLQGASETKKIVADKLEIENQEYEVLEVQPWSGANRIKAWMVICVRVDAL